MPSHFGNMQGRRKGTIFVLLCVACWALIPVVAKLGQTQLDSHQFLFWSSLVSFIVLSGYSACVGKLALIKELNFIRWVHVVVLGLLGTYIYYFLLYLGYREAKGFEVLVIQYTWPVWIMILSVIILREKLTWTKISAVLIGLLGVMMVLSKGRLHEINVSHPQVILLVLAGAFCFGLFSVLNKSMKEDAVMLTALYFMVATIASLGSMFFYSTFKIPDLNDWLPILLNGVLVNGFSYLFWKIALNSTEASYLAPFTFITPVLSSLYLIFFFSEPFLPAYGVGMGCVVLAGWMNSRQSSVSNDL